MIRLAILDLDGTVYRGSELVPGALEAISILRSRNVLVRFLTNNSAVTRSEIAAKLCSLGVVATTEECFGTAWGVGEFLRHEGITSAFVVGEDGLSKSLRSAGIEVTDGPAEAVVAGICRHFDYNLLDAAMQQCRSGARFIATNTDATYPIEQGREAPGAGAMVSAIQTATGIVPEVIGKPEPYLVLKILEMASCTPEETVMVGDRLETDIEAGHRAGCSTFLVLSGVTSVPPNGQSSGATLMDLLARIGQ